MTYNVDKAFDGYNLLYPNFQSNVFLINNCGQVVHKWEDDIEYRPGNTAYILSDGSLMKTKRPDIASNPTFSNGGAGGMIEWRSWDNDLLWSKVILDSLERAHHDIEPMPNGNVLVISWERKFKQELINAGRDTTLMPADELWPDFIREFDPIADSVVWEWHAWDHMIQDFDSTKENYGSVSEHPELIDINYDLNGHGGRPDFMHSNSIDYNPHLDQILLSVAYFDELWIIDHSTTTEEASTHTGGNMGRGGDLLFRWGNPRAYKKGDFDDQKLFFQHDAHWIIDTTLTSNLYFNQIAVFNNRVGNNYSSINILQPDPDNYQGPNGEFPPEEFSLNLTHPDKESLHSTSMSSVQILPNNNFLICASRSGYSFEMTSQQEIIWEYRLPMIYGNPIAQGTSLDLGDNMHFRIDRYSVDYSGFENKVFTNDGYIELDHSQEFCELSPVENVIDPSLINLYPNPSCSGSITLIETPDSLVEIYGIDGRKKMSFFIRERKSIIDINILPSGVYFLKVGAITTKFIIC